MENYPDTIQIGDVKKVSYKDGILYTENGNFNIGHVDMLIGGSPCQDFSIAHTMCSVHDSEKYGLKGDKSKLFYEYLRIKQETNPTVFFLENVRMKKDSEKQLNEYLGVEGIHIDSSTFTYQHRRRIYWTNIKDVSIPEDKNVDFQDYKDTDYEYCKQFKVKPTKSRLQMWNNGETYTSSTLRHCQNVTNMSKIGTVTRKQDRCPNSGLIEFEDFCRYLTRKELEQAQTLPIGYTDCLSYNQACDVIGDCWTVDVIKYIFSFMF